MSGKISRRSVATGLGALGLAQMLPRPARAEFEALVEAARKEGTLTWYTAHTDGETAEATGRAFTAAYPGVKVSVIRTTAQVAYERLLQDIKNNVAQCDVFSSTDPGHDEALKKRGLLAKITPQNAAGLSAPFQGVDPDGTYYPTSAGLVLITYNTKKVKAEDAPKNWPDLLDPKWRRQISVGHPAFSGYVGTWVLAMRNLYGWQYFEKLEKNQPQIGRSVNDTVTMLNSGERSVAAGPSGTTLMSADKGNPLALIYPTDGAVLLVSPSAVMANAPHPNAARLFMEFLLSDDHARLSVESRNESLRPGVLPKAGAKPFSEAKIIRLSTAEIQKGIPEVIEQWRDTFGS
ncbi:ABC transporter substrate-binding protein [Limobrevibacterium gyesilva]|uniref:Extracellular solute-binding protein n=1 Tax=Limobrevibacterium gyesilva TaxID=2991712 RepID=A0AA42CFP8_9PROT|nr:extracellular solute-binding protein [Limobrevibacterium gyesilva]MCW3473222.1 extracellular solute-binding protein [Limobrevibacterium gyesilva]